MYVQATGVDAHSVLDHVQQSVVVDERGTHHTDVEKLVAGGPRVEPAGEDALGELKNIEEGSEYVEAAHHKDALPCIDDVLTPEPLTQTHVYPGDDSVGPKEDKGREAERPVLGSGKLFPEGHDDARDTEQAGDGDVSVAGGVAAVEPVVVARDAGTGDEYGDARVVETTEDIVHSLRVVAEEMEEGGAGEADHGRQEEAEQHGLVDGGQLVDLDVFKEEGDVVSVDVDPETEDQEEGEPEKVCPYVPRFGVHAEHALETAAERVHGRTVAVGQIFVVLHPLGEFVERE